LLALAAIAPTRRSRSNDAVTAIEVRLIERSCLRSAPTRKAPDSNRNRRLGGHSSVVQAYLPVCDLSATDPVNVRTRCVQRGRANQATHSVQIPFPCKQAIRLRGRACFADAVCRGRSVGRSRGRQQPRNEEEPFHALRPRGLRGSWARCDRDAQRGCAACAAQGLVPPTRRSRRGARRRFRCRPRPRRVAGRDPDGQLRPSSP
jgi:hypothetical protein